MKRSSMWLALVLCSLLAVTIWYPRSVLLVNARVLTMDPQGSVAEALLIHGQYIRAVGSREVLSQDLPFFTKTVDMKGQSLLPGFVDAHSHFPSAGLTDAGLDLTPPPVGGVGTMTQLLDAVAGAIATNPDGQWIVGLNYDNASLTEQRHPTRQELDAIAPKHPVYLWHRSGHMGVANTLALTELGYRDLDSQANDRPPKLTPTAPPDRDKQGRLTGLLQGSAGPRLGFLLKQLPYRKLFKSVLSARDQYLHAGVTTVQNGFADYGSMQMLRWVQRLGIVPQRIIVWPSHDKMADRIKLPTQPSSTATPSQILGNAIAWRGQSQRFAISAIKLVADGSPQGRTAWLTEPYVYDKDLPVGFRGFPHMPEDEFKSIVVRYHSAGVQLAMHGNGDAAIDLIISSLAAAQLESPEFTTRHIVVHAQTIRQDQLEALAQLGASVTFFPTHTYYWGDWHRDRVLGEERANRISPLAEADTAQVPYSLHSDAPVTPVSPMGILWSATNRITLQGDQLGPSLIISRDRALRAMTIDAAWQNYLEQDRGSLEVGKLADIIALSGDPLSEPDVRTLQVQRVWIGGRDVFER